MKRKIVVDASAISKILASAIVVIVVVIGVSGVYYLAFLRDNNPSFGAIANFRVGAYTEYILKSYNNNGSLSSEMQAKWSVDDGVYNGTNCWLLSINNSETSTENVETEIALTVYLSKSTLESVHVKTQMYLDGDLVFEDESGPDSTEFNDMIPKQFPPQYVAYETVIVPAGTFSGCGKVTEASSGSVFNAWVHKDVPVWGIVKMESYEGEILVSTMELKTYS